MMKSRLQVGIIDLLGKEPPINGYSRFMRCNNISIMAQVVGVWCQEAGHVVHMAYYSGAELIAGGLPDKLDIVFVNAYTQNALLAYAFSHFYRDKGVVTVLGGPHARSYPENAQKHFDYVVGFCNKDTLLDILLDCSPHRPVGLFVSASQQPDSLPGLRQRWPFLKPAMERAKLLRGVPLLGSMGCPYNCNFCVDSDIPYQPLDYDTIQDDLRFFQELKLPRSIIAWHDPNFGIRFNDYMDLIEEVVPPGGITFAGEMTLALLTEDNVKRMARNSFKAIAPGIESWFGVGSKSKIGQTTGTEKVDRIAEHLNLVNQYVPYVQANLIFGLDIDEGEEPFELTKRFVDQAPGIYPHFAMLSAYGRNTALNLELQKAGRILPVPFHFLDLIQSMNVKPLNYSWPTFYDHVIDTFEYTFSRRAVTRRFRVNKHPIVRFEQVFRAISAEHNNRIAYQRKIRAWLDQPEFRAFFEGETQTIPTPWVDTIRKHLGPLWKWLPEDTLYYDPNAYLNTEAGQQQLAAV